MGPIEFEPIYKERVWGGRNLEGALGRRLPPDRPIGESWEVVDRPEAQSVVRSGPDAGKTLRQILERNGAELMGPAYAPNRPFPILVKWLDCEERLSLQVHPPASVAGELGGEPKTENWYVAAVKPGAGLIVGLKNGATREAFEKAIKEQTLEPLVHRFEVHAGDSILVESGRIHAIDGGNLILEIQQNSDTTYRVYDWGRLGLDGKPRELHVEESLKSIDFQDFEPEPLRAGSGYRILADCAEFRIRKFEPSAGEEPVSFKGGEEPRLLHVVSGRVSVAGPDGTVSLEKGANVLIPFAGDFDVSADAGSVFLVTDRFV